MNWCLSIWFMAAVVSPGLRARYRFRNSWHRPHTLYFVLALDSSPPVFLKVCKMSPKKEFSSSLLPRFYKKRFPSLCWTGKGLYYCCCCWLTEHKNPHWVQWYRFVWYCTSILFVLRDYRCFPHMIFGSTCLLFVCFVLYGAPQCLWTPLQWLCSSWIEFGLSKTCWEIQGCPLILPVCGSVCIKEQTVVMMTTT